LHETGQPLHAFDLNKLTGKQIIVRRAANGEELKTLDGVERKLSSEMLVIADAERAVAVAAEAEETIFKLLPTGMSREGSEVERMAERIRCAGSGGISRSDLTRTFQHIRQRERDERLRTLVDSGRVLVKTGKTAGRDVHLYIHQDNCAEDQPDPSER